MGSPSRRRRPLAAVALVLACLACAPAASAARISTPEARLVRQINRVRAAHLAPALRLDPSLERAARSHSQDMLDRGYFAHGAFADRLVRFGVRSHLVGENLAWSSGRTLGAAAVVQMWLDSPGHRRVMLTRGFRRIGVALPVGPFDGYDAAVMVTADFSA